jgi:carbamoyl-phosphate synthase large subunit
LVVSEYLPGKEVTVDSLVLNGEPKVILARQRDAMRDGISVAGHFIDSKDVDDQVRSIVKAIPGLNGPVGFQFKMSESGRFSLLESNPRLQGTTVAAHGLGYNFPQEALQLSLGGIVKTANRTAKVGFRRYYQEVFFEL